MPDFELHATAIAAPSVRALLHAWRVPKGWIATLRRTQGVLIAGAYRHFNAPVAAGEPVTLRFTAPGTDYYRPEALPLQIVYQDAALLIVAKPAGQKPHPNRPDEGGTLMNAAAGYLAPRPVYITHRLDMLTSGLTLIAKDPISQGILNQQLASKTAARTYTALVPRGLPAVGTISAPIGQDPADKRKRMVQEDGLPAVTHFRVIAETKATARLALTLETGRTHQLRVHLAHLGYPIIGDPLYGGRPAARLMLHASALTLVRPFSSQVLTVTAPAPF
ncbi:RluA family pseudouridine synthase [Lacticaseibacillus jixianensis]|uniref:RNA pseudouridylate synthase n=1 Tax=Lacticaseibacillus jixianensis TaxID=2486012 RepID=A0ABW4B8X2_9LACO|nr:RluA family pseudouridine synthase [Lacticaseibacillus jixianensis]